jgi:hypothetical protein
MVLRKVKTMKASHNARFSSPELRKAIDDARPILEGADEAMSRVSRDIKNLEDYLQGLGLKHPYRYWLGKYFASDDKSERDVAMALEFTGGVGGTIGEEALAWDQDAKGKFRLLYEVYRWEGGVEVDMPGGPFHWDESTEQREAKPLIEMKFDVRKRMYRDHLTDFVKKLTEHLRVDRPPPDDELPF